tara:strand:+ start:165 stop:983 length:819 start_codon:yes stop_codon:yes gene_type:complete
MRKPLFVCFLIFSVLLINGCSAKQPTTPSDPYEKINRKTYAFNQALDATLFRPVAKIYQAILPPQVHDGIRNAFNNLQMLPTVANDLLQLQFLRAYKDSWRFLINSTIGIGGIFDVANKWDLPYSANDFGITLAKWGDKNSPYFVMPFFGPSTFRDSVGITYDYNVMSAYAYLRSRKDAYELIAINTVQIRADLIGTDTLVDDALDEYTLVRDAYLQNRLYNINGEKDTSQATAGSLYIEGEEDLKSQSLYVDDDEEYDAPITQKGKENVKK